MEGVDVEMKLKKHNENGLNDNNSNRTMTESDNKTVLQVLASILYIK